MNPLAELIGECPGIAAVRETVGRLLQRQSDARRLPPILIQGETGTGKGLLARGVHRAGPRAAGPFVDVNCAAIPETLLEAELFGFERGAFTDARQAKPGLFQTAHRGTIFLDEVGLLPEALQAKLLKAIEERAVRRLGSTRSEPLDVWIFTATNEDLGAATRERRFREDLYHRLAVLTLQLPPLRERGDDVLVLAEHFLVRACAEYGLRAKAFAPDARNALQAYAWPGNVRELANLMERVALLSEAALVTADVLGLPQMVQAGLPVDALPDRATALEDAMGRVEREHLLEALGRTSWNITHAAVDLGISRDTLRYRIAKHGLRPHGPPRAARRPPTRREPAKAPAASIVASEVGAPTAVRWDRRRLAVVRAALVVPAAVDPRLYPSRALEVVVEKVQSFGGRVEELGPTGIVATFGLEPVEDAPRRAAHAALAIQKAAERARRSDSDALPVKVAIHVGPFLIGQGGGEVQLDLDSKRQAWTVLEALLARGEPDTILASEAAALFLERRFEVVPVGTPGEGTGQAFLLAGPERTGLELGRRMAPFVGRRHELELLHSRLALAMRGHGQVVGVLGEAGIGKSRLLFEFQRSLLEMRDREGLRLTLLLGRCEPYGSAIPYLPVLQVLRQNFRITELDSPEEITEKVRLGLQEVAMDPDETAPYILHLFGVKEGTERLLTLSPGAIKVRTSEALRQLILTGARRRPILFVVEDLQWVDATSEECFTALMDSAAGAPAMAVVTYRPGHRPPWVERSYATQVALQPLSHEDTLSVVRSVLNMDEVPDRLARVILEKTEGNPFFAEELARTVAQTGDLRLPVAVPDTIHEVLLARIDPLTERAKRLLQTAAVLGQEVPSALLRALWEDLETLDTDLHELLRLEFLYALSGGPEPTYAFTHNLTREVAYESLPAAPRQALHTKAGQAIEAIYADRLEEVHDRLAYHYARTERADKAIEYLRRLGEKAARGHAHSEAVQTFEEALAHVDRLPPSEQDQRRLDLAVCQAYSLFPLGRFQAVVDLLLRHRAALERTGDPALAGHYHFLRARSFLFLGDDAQATEHAQMAIAEATRSGDDAMLGRAHYVLAQRGALSGTPEEGLEHGRRATALLERAGEHWWIGPTLWALGLNHIIRGEFEPALEAEARAAALGEAIGDPELQCSAAWAAGFAHAARGDWERGVEACRRSLERAPDPLNSAMALGSVGYAHLEKGDLAQAIPALERATEQVGQFGFRQLHGMFTAFLAEAHRLSGSLDRALELGQRALDATHQSHFRFGVGWAHRVLGRVALATGDSRTAQSHLREALDTFASVETRHEVARTHLDLAALCHTQQNREAVRQHLDEAQRLFSAARAPKHEERTARLARDFGAALPARPGE